MTIGSARNGRTTLALAFTCFVAVGTVNGVLGVAWPSIQASFSLPLDALAWLLISSTIGFFTGSVLAAQLIEKLGFGRSLLVCSFVAALAVFGYVTAPSWWMMVACGLFVGAGGGAMTTALNIHIAATGTVRTMNWMHASFSIGASIGPLLMTAIIVTGQSWRLGYMVAGLVYLALGFSFLAALKQGGLSDVARSSSDEGEAGGPADARRISPAETLRLPVVWLSLVLFFLYTGVEASAGQWAYSLFTEGREVSTYVAGVMTSVFWAMLALGRLVFGAAAVRIGVERLLRLAMVGVLLSATLLVVRVTPVGFVALALLGLSLSSIFPTLTAHTPRRVGVDHAANAISFQTGAASIGLALLPSLAGFLAARIGLESLGPFLVVGSLLMLAANQAASRLARRGRVVTEKAAARSAAR